LIVSLNEAKSFIGIALDDVSNDVILQIILDSTEEQIRDFCHKHDSPEIIGGDGTVAPAVTYTFKGG
jgi:hypothetical protein